MFVRLGMSMVLLASFACAEAEDRPPAAHVSQPSPVAPPPAPTKSCESSSTAGASIPSLAPAPEFAVPSDALHIDPSGSLSDTIRSAPAGSTVIVRAGTYPRLVVKTRHEKTVNVVGEHREGTVIQGITLQNAANIAFRRLTVRTEKQKDDSAVLVDGSQDITLEGLVIDPVSEAGVDIINGSHDVNIEHSTITGARVKRFKGSGRNIHIGSGSTDLTRWVSKVTVRESDLSGAAADAIQVAGATDVLIEHNFIHDLQVNGDHNDGVQSVASDGLRIVRNTFTALKSSEQDTAIIVGHLGGAVGPPPHPNMKVRNTVVANNLVHHWKGAGINVSGTDNLEVVNNTSFDNFRGKRSFPAFVVAFTQHDNRDLRVVNNLLSDVLVSGKGSAISQSRNVIAGGGAGPADLATDPCFADRSEYRLADGSPAIDLGEFDGAPSIDLDGRLRLGRPDAGSREWNGATR